MIQLHWHTEPLLIISLLFSGWLYTVLTGPLRNNLFPDQSLPLAKKIVFLAGLVVIYITVGSPLDQVGEEYLFAAHMIQHTLLIYVAPLFFYFGTPGWLLDRLLKIKIANLLVGFFVKPLVSGVLFTLCFSIWHIPELYEAALHNKALHVLEHWTMFGCAILMWWSFVSPSKIIPASSYPIRMLFIFLLMVGQLPVFGYLTFSGNVLYETYEYAVRLNFFNVTPLEDQVIGGVIMKISNMILSLTIFGISFYLWQKKDNQ